MIDPIILIFKHRRNIYICFLRISHPRDVINPSILSAKDRPNEGCLERCPASRNPLNSLSNSNIQWVSTPQPPISTTPPFLLLFILISSANNNFTAVRRVKRRKKEARAPLKRSRHCNIPINAFLLVERDKRFFRSMPYLKRANISSTQFIWRRFEKTRRWNNFREKKFFEIQFSKKGKQNLFESLALEIETGKEWS